MLGPKAKAFGYNLEFGPKAKAFGYSLEWKCRKTYLDGH